MCFAFLFCVCACICVCTCVFTCVGVCGGQKLMLGWMFPLLLYVLKQVSPLKLEVAHLANLTSQPAPELPFLLQDYRRATMPMGIYLSGL